MAVPRFFSRDLKVKVGVFSAACIAKACTNMDGVELTGLAAAAYPVINTVVDGVASLSGNLAASSADESEARKRAWDDLLHNADLSRAIGTALSKRLSLSRDDMLHDLGPLVDRLSAEVVEKWGQLAQEDAVFLQPLADDRLTEQLTAWLQNQGDPPPLSAGEWQAFLGTMLTDEERADARVLEMMQRLGIVLEEHVVHDLIEVLKDDLANGGRAYAAISIQFFTDIAAGIDELKVSMKLVLDQHQALIVQHHAILKLSDAWGNFLADQADRNTGQLAQQADRNTERIISKIGNGSAPVPPPPPFQPVPAANKYFGRADLVAELTARLQKDQRVEVWGGPGMGKTALAAEAVSRLVGTTPESLAGSRFPHGLVFLNLYQHKTLEVAWGALAQAFDDDVDTKLPAKKRAEMACGHRRALVILEGAEELKTQLNELLSVLAPETTQLILTRDGSQTGAVHRIHLEESLEAEDALSLVRYLAGQNVPWDITAAVQARLGGHPLALTWAGKALRTALEPPQSFLLELLAKPFTALTAPGGNEEHTLRWQFERSVRLLKVSARTVLAAAARVAEPFGMSLAECVHGSKTDLKRLVQLSFLRADTGGWSFGHALVREHAIELALPEGLLARLGEWVVAGLSATDASYGQDGGHLALDQALSHATALLRHDKSGGLLQPVVNSLIYTDKKDTFGARLGRIDLDFRIMEAVGEWLEQSPLEKRKTSDWQRERSIIHSGHGSVAMAQGNFEKAYHCFVKAKAMVERLAESDPENAGWQRDLSVTLEKLGTLAAARGHFADALRFHGEEKIITERLAARTPDDIELQRDLWVANGKLGDLAISQDDLAEAARLWAIAHTITQQLAAKEPDNIVWQRDLSISLGKLGRLAVKQGDHVSALRYYTEAQAISTFLVAKDPANAGWQRDLSVSLERLGETKLAQGDISAALQYFTESKKIRELLAETDPSNAEWQRNLSVSHFKLGHLAKRVQDETMMMSEFRACFGILDGMRQRGWHLETQAAWLHGQLAEMLGEKK